jgi:hypothetical protein
MVITRRCKNGEQCGVRAIGFPLTCNSRDVAESYRMPKFGVFCVGINRYADWAKDKVDGFVILQRRIRN